MIYKEGAEQRIKRYKKYEQLYNGDHVAAFHEKLRNIKKENLIYIVQNLCAVISNISADYLVGGGVMVRSQDEQQQDVINDINAKVHYDTLIYESALTAAYMGDVVMLIHKDENGDVTFSVMNPKKYHPIYNSIHSNVVDAVEIWHEFDEDGKDYLLVEAYTKGMIKRVLYQVEYREDGMHKSQIPLNTFFELEEEQATNLDFIPIVHIKNFSTAGSRWGISDLKQIESLQHALNNRLSQIDTILDKHADPKMVIPEGVLDKHRGVDRSEMELFELPGGEDSVAKPEYITWQANLKEAFEDVDLLIKQIARVADIPLSLLGMDSSGAVESGVAIRLKYASLLKKIGRKELYFRQGLEELYRKILLAMDFSDPKVSVEFGDPLPENKIEEITIIGQRLANGVMSKRQAVSELDDVTGEELDEIMSEIEGEQPRIIQSAPPALTLPNEQ